ncbi:MAG: polymerase, sigma-24 subunit, subfamily [Caulobacteraceae bacterium]|nr:polymerase, sigma-24 subunit, subfamily [Caulobacteraceae bacterium]
MAQYQIDDAAFKTQLISLIPHMRAFARSLCHDAALAEDMAQDALAKAWSARASFQPGTNLKAWTFMILRNVFYSDKRRSWRSCELDQTVAENTLIAISNPSAALELNDLRRAMAMLPKDQREALALVGAAGMSYEEASGICGVPVGTIKSRVSRARTRLAELLEEGDLIDDAILPSAAMAAILAGVDALRPSYRPGFQPA